MVKADITSSDTANYFIDASHVTKSQLQAAMHFSNKFTMKTAHPIIPMPCNLIVWDFEEWCVRQANVVIHFDYKLKTVSLELLLLRFI